MIFNIPLVTPSILNQISTTLKEHGIDTSQVGVFKDIAFKIAMIQNTIAPKLCHPTHHIIAINESAKDVFNFDKALKNTNPVIESFNNTQLLTIEYFNYKKELNTVKNPNKIEFSDYEKALENGADLALKSYNAGSNCISFGTTCRTSGFSASMVIAEITNTTIDECLHFNNQFTKTEKEALRDKIIDVMTANTPMTLAEIMCVYGELDIAAIVGGILKAAELKMVILIDSFVVTSALLFAYQLNEAVIDYCIFCNQSNHKGHRLIIDYFEKMTILNLDFESNEGLAVPISLPILHGATKWLNDSLKTN